MARIRITQDKKVELDELWLEWHRSLEGMQITAMMEAGRDHRSGTTDWEIDDRFKVYLKGRNFHFTDVPSAL